MECSLHDSRLTLTGLFFEAHAGLARELERKLEAECGLTAQWFEILLRLARTEGGRLRMTDLARQVTLTSSGLTRAVDRLEAAGLVRRESCPSDRRGSNCVLTAKGRKRIEAAVPAHLDHIDVTLTSLLDHDEQAAFESILRKLRDTLRPESRAGATEASPCG